MRLQSMSLGFAGRGLDSCGLRVWVASGLHLLGINDYCIHLVKIILYASQPPQDIFHQPACNLTTHHSFPILFNHLLFGLFKKKTSYILTFGRPGSQIIQWNVTSLNCIDTIGRFLIRISGFGALLGGPSPPPIALLCLVFITWESRSRYKPLIQLLVQ